MPTVTVHLKSSQKLLCSVVTWVALGLIGTAGTISAQSESAADSVTGTPFPTMQTVDGSIVDAFPFDRLADVLGFLPGVAATNDGSLSVRGGEADENAVYVDGVPVTPGLRVSGTALLGGSYYGARGSGIGLGTNAVEAISLTTGPYPVEFGNAQSGLIRVTTIAPPARWHATGSYEGDSPFGSGHTLGLNRLQLRAGGPLTSRLGFVMAGVLEGQASERLGLDQNRPPIFVQSGVDTTFSVTNGGSTAPVDVSRFVPSSGIRIPASAQTVYQLLGKVVYRLGERSQLSLLALASQDQHRLFDYQNLYNPRQLGGIRSWSRVYALSWSGDLGRPGGRPLSLEAHLSYQTDRTLSGPLDSGSEADTRDPFAGLLVKPLGFRFNLDNFPLDDALVNRYRLGQPGTSPYDLNNVGQYVLIQLFRGNAYGLTGFSDGGGPVGLLEMRRENRLAARAVATWAFSRHHTLTLGGEFTRYNLDNYSHELTSTLSSDIYLEAPVAMGLFAADRVVFGDLTFGIGGRYDRFDTRARRPADFPRLFTAPGFDPNDPTKLLQRDPSRGRFSPHLNAAFALDQRTRLRAGYAEQVQVPDFSLNLLGINTDFKYATLNTTFGTALDFARSRLFEIGARHAFGGGFEVGLGAYTKTRIGEVTTKLQSRFDPVDQKSVLLPFLTNAGGGRVRGIELTLDRHLGSYVTGTVSYSYQDAKLAGGDPSPNSRPHTVAGLLALTLPDGWRHGSLIGGVLQNLTAAAAFRFASGTAYTTCAGNESVLSDQFCSAVSPGPFDGARLPAFKVLDLRLSKDFGIGRQRLSVYLDARNLLNLKSLVRVYSTNGDVVNPLERAFNRVVDSSGFAREGAANGVYNGATGDLDLAFGGAGLAGCAGWVRADGLSAPPSCAYLIRAEERFGNGDHIFSLAEQRRVSDALYDVSRGLQNFTAPGRRVRIGVEVRF